MWGWQFLALSLREGGKDLGMPSNGPVSQGHITRTGDDRSAEATYHSRVRIAICERYSLCLRNK